MRKLGGTATILAVLALTACAGGPAENFDMTTLDTSDYQSRIVSDGVVTPAEYDQSLLAYRDCVVAVGAVPGEMVETGNNARGFEYEVTAPTEEQAEQILAASDECLVEFHDAVALAWSSQNIPSDHDRRALLPTVISCLQNVGVDVGDDATVEDVIYLQPSPENSAGLQQCVREFPEFFVQAPTNEDASHEDHEL